VAQASGLLDVYRLAREHDPRWRAAGFEFQATSESEKQARAALLPTITLDFERVETEQKILSSNNPIFGVGSSRFPTDSRVLTLTQPIFRASSWARLAQAKAVVKQAAAANAAAEQDLMLRVAAAYLGVLAARDGLALAAAEREAVGRHLELAQARLDRGLGTIANLHDARARYTVTQAREIEARNKLQDAGQALREITARTIEGLLPLRAEIPLVAPDPPSVEQWLSVAENQNLRLESRRQAVEVASEEVRRQRGGHAPSVTLVGTNTNRRAGGTVFGGGSHTDTTDLALRLSIPIFEGGATSSLTREAAMRRSKALEELDFEWRQLERQARAAFQGVQSGISLVAALRNTVDAQEKAVETKEEGRRAGLTTLLPVLDAQRDLYFARRDYAQARYDYLMNRLRLKETAGTLSEQDLVAIDALLQRR
jgi:outer membrane protein